MLRVALLDDHPAVLAGLQRLLDSTADLQAVSVTDNTPQLLREFDSVRPDVVVLDYDLARGDGLTLCQTLKERVRPPAVVIYSAYAGSGLAISSRLAGADALVDKRAAASELIETIRRVAAGESIIADVPPDAQQAAVERLAPDDVPVASMLLAGTSHQGIAEALATDRRDVVHRVRRIVGQLRPPGRATVMTNAYCRRCRTRFERPLPQPYGSICPACVADGDIVTLTPTATSSPSRRRLTQSANSKPGARAAGASSPTPAAVGGAAGCQAMPEGPPLNVVIAGAGWAGLEAMFRLHRLAGPRARITLLAPNEEFSNHALDVLVPFATPCTRRQNLRKLTSAAGAQPHRGRVSSIDAAEHHVITDAAETVAYDVLLLAIGAVQRAPWPHSLCFGSDGSHERMHGLVQDVEAGYVRRVAFVMPAGPTWPVALYELALMTAERAFDQCQTCELTLLTGESAPLAIFGAATARALRDRLQTVGITLRTSVDVEVPVSGQVAIDRGAERLIVDRVITVPVLNGPAVTGLEHDGDGFLLVDHHGRVEGANDVYAAGDVTSGPIKHGSLACRQADAAAEAIATHAGVALEPAAISSVLEGVLLTEREALLMRCEVDAAGPAAEVLRRGAPGWPPTKINGRELVLYLDTPLSGTGA